MPVCFHIFFRLNWTPLTPPLLHGYSFLDCALIRARYPLSSALVNAHCERHCSRATFVKSFCGRMTIRLLCYQCEYQLANWYLYPLLRFSNQDLQYCLTYLVPHLVQFKDQRASCTGRAFRFLFWSPAAAGDPFLLWFHQNQMYIELSQHLIHIRLFLISIFMRQSLTRLCLVDFC